jgi:TorA maturation chaperone TorD
MKRTRTQVEQTMLKGVRGAPHRENGTEAWARDGTLESTRIGAYRWLAAAFRRPSVEQIMALVTEDALAPVLGALGLIPSSGPATLEHLLLDFRREAGADAKGLARELTVEYCRLFLGPDTLPCPPYGSVYLDRGQAMGPTALDALSRYRGQGLDVTRGWREPPDHIAVELEFLAWLADGYRQALDRRDAKAALDRLTVQGQFLDDHLGRWAPALADSLRAATSTSLYRFAGDFVQAWAACDRNLVDALSEALSREPVRCG